MTRLYPFSRITFERPLATSAKKGCTRSGTMSPIMNVFPVTNERAVQLG